MKDAEDEAFDELAKRQGMWGGGFQAKRAAAADKQKPAQSNEFQVIPGIDEAGAEHMAQPAQGPVAWMWKDMRGQDVVSLFEPRLNSIPLYIIPPKRPWVGLTDEEIAQGNKESWVDKQAWQSAVWWAEAKLKQKNGFAEEKNT